MLTGTRRRDERIDALLRFVAANDASVGVVPSGLEERIVAFAVGAAAVRVRARGRHVKGWIVGVAALCAAATVAGVVALPWFDEAKVTSGVGQPIGSAPLSATIVEHREAEVPVSADIAVVETVIASPDSRTRRAAILHLRRNVDGRSPEAEAALARAALTDPNWHVREAALATFLDRPRSTVDWVLAEAMADPHIALRFAALAAVSAISEIGPATRHALEARLLHDPDWRVRESALNLLLRDGPRDRAAALALRDSHRRLREIGERALAIASVPSRSFDMFGQP